ncbi:MAG: hypothetical protein UT33_C0008G0016 [Candidatus Peregrinibacteria bacterium GW2011_GWC2_39_14]|nr:MAG: hypothetical protein US92_C0004G0016 [Candidatus Peregrinibacteria bacterium GW2011_GWA2_38_36]KKR06700.1 MAG: hypothetical protein UT33_C0008G0016 [Candidatus Peregrinibacteria bacterium GW2011_GWC2_39_14]
MIRKNKNRRSHIAQPRKGIAVIVALIFMMAMLTISTTVANTATNMATSTGGSYKSTQAFYNAETAMETALYNYKHPNAGVLSGAPSADQEGAGEMQWKVLGVGSDEGLTNEITDSESKVWSSYPFPGSGTAGKDCDAYDAPIDMKSFTASLMKYISTTESTAMVADMEKTISNGGMGEPQDHPCNWNKLKDTDSAIEIPLYGVDGEGNKQQIEFSAFQVRVRTACDAKAIKSSNGGDSPGGGANGDQGNGPTGDELIYEGAGMCEAEKRYGMYVKDGEANTIVNWGLYTEDDGSYMVPIKDITDKNATNSSNITAWNIKNKQEIGFAVLDAEDALNPAMGMINIKTPETKGKKRISEALKKITNPYLRLTLEFPFAGKHYFAGGIDGSTSIPNLEYQILYKTNGDPAAGTSQISGVPVIIGEGYSGGFRHMIRANIYETPTGFDYIYQKP